MVENRFNKQAEVKKKESVKTNSPLSFLLYFSCWSGSKIDEKTVKTSTENESEFKCGFEVDFLNDFLRFSVHLGTQNATKIRKKGLKNMTILR